MRSLSKLRLIFIISLVILAGLLVLTLRFIPSGQNYPESHITQIIDNGDEWILQCDIVNNERRDIEYSIHVTIDGAVYTDSTVVKPGRTYTYIHHIYPQQLTEGRVVFTLYQAGKTDPVDQTVYYIDIN